MNGLDKIFAEQMKADELFGKLNKTHSMDEVADIVEGMDENMAKIVLKMFVYSRGMK